MLSWLFAFDLDAGGGRRFYRHPASALFRACRVWMMRMDSRSGCGFDGNRRHILGRFGRCGPMIRLSIQTNRNNYVRRGFDCFRIIYRGVHHSGHLMIHLAYCRFTYAEHWGLCACAQTGLREIPDKLTADTGELSARVYWFGVSWGGTVPISAATAGSSGMRGYSVHVRSHWASVTRRLRLPASRHSAQRAHR